MKNFGRWIAIFFCIYLSSCGLNGALVTMESFQDVPVGASSSEVKEILGEPYAIHKKPDGMLEYEYIERLTAGPRNFEERHYYIILKNDQVVSRRIETSSPVPYLFDSYEMQTTQN